ncbi:MAG: LPS assembly lipoprotein LptE [Kiloniellales bacterium]|nr:LPS assembly lipoprotein LptE [Kiloniellales bacterium]
MSSRDRALALLVAALLTVSGCGFRPLYAPSEGPDTVQQTSFAQTRIVPLTGQSGQKLHNLLRDRLNPEGQRVEHLYILRVLLESRVVSLGIREDETATRANLIVTAIYTLTSREGAVLFEARSESVNSYNILDAFYATSVSEEDALDRGLREVANEIERRLGIYFTRDA